MTIPLLNNPEIMSTMSQLFQDYLTVLLDGPLSLYSVGVYRAPPPNSLGTEPVSSARAWRDRNLRISSASFSSFSITCLIWLLGQVTKPDLLRPAKSDFGLIL